MDEIKDIKNTDQISRFLEGHTIHTNPFGANTSGEKIYHRAERIVAALFLLSSHVPHDEPLYGAIRRKGLELLTDILATRDEMRNSHSAKIKKTVVSVREIISLMRMLGISGFISIQNADVIVEALDELSNFLSASQRSALSESVVFSREDFLAGNVFARRGQSLSRSRTSLPQHARKPNISDIKDTKMSFTKVPDTVVRGERDAEDPGKTSVQRTIGVRAQAILDILRAGGDLGIRDIASNLPEYSEKMIQRELAILIAAQKAKKTGSKRWSRYSLA